MICGENFSEMTLNPMEDLWGDFKALRPPLAIGSEPFLEPFE
jgi:hypothetical protein